MRKKRIFCLMLDEFQIQALAKCSNGISRLACFEHLLLNAERQTTTHTKRGISYTVPVGSLDISEEELSAQWKCNRTTVHRMLKEWEELGLITMKANNVTTIVSIICLQSWYVGRDTGGFVKNEAFRYPNLMTDQPIENFVPVRKRKPTATAKKSNSMANTFKASQSVATDSETKDVDRTAEVPDSAVTSVAVSLSSNVPSSGQRMGDFIPTVAENLVIEGVQVANNGQASPKDISNDIAHTYEEMPSDEVHETSKKNLYDRTLSDDVIQSSDKAQQNLRPQTEPSA